MLKDFKKEKEMPKEIIEKYKGQVPDEVIEIWKNYGLGSFLNGYLRVINPDDYKADLRLVFPFCIPFDLVHLIQAFEAEPEAPVFEFPFDLELENPWTGKKILDYHHVFKLDMSDYEPVIKIFRIFEIIFFIIGLLMITRQQMIKG